MNQYLIEDKKLSIDLPKHIQKIKHKRFGEIYAPKTFIEFSTWIEYFTLELNTIQGWRGQANIDWNMESTALRRIKNTKEKANAFFSEEYGDINNISAILLTYENKLLEQIKHEGYNYHNSKQLSELESIAKIRHHGGATRLLDFSYNIFVPLWFTCLDDFNIEKDGLIIGCQRQKTGSYVDLSYEESKNKISEILKKYESRIIFWKPSYIVERMLIQQSFFAFGDIFEKDDDYFNSTEYQEKFQESFVAVAIPPSLKKDIRKYGETFLGLKSLIYPDFDGFCQLNNQSKLLPDLLECNNKKEMNKFNNISEVQ